MNEWSHKKELSRIAYEHTVAMRERYSKEISECESFIWHDNLDSFIDRNTTSIAVQMNTVEALFSKYCKDWKENKICVLNFANYKYPGGGFLNGNTAQEESLCHASYLYNVLSNMQPYYEFNRMHLNKGMYLNRAIYSRNIRFFFGNKTMRCDVLTCSPPNFVTGDKYKSFTWQENNKTVMDRIRFIKSVVGNYDVDIMVLGAWGCDTFGQKDRSIARLFVKDGFPAKKIVFAVPDDEHFKIFNKMINERRGK